MEMERKNRKGELGKRGIRLPPSTLRCLCALGKGAPSLRQVQLSALEPGLVRGAWVGFQCPLAHLSALEQRATYTTMQCSWAEGTMEAEESVCKGPEVGGHI